MSQKVLQISAEDAKYIDPKQIVSLTMVDGSTIYVRDEEDFVEENQEGVEQAASEQVPQQQQQPLRGLGTNLALGVAAATTAALGAAALGKAIAGPRPMVARPMVAPVMAPMRGPVMAPRPMGPVMGPRPMGPVMRPMGPVFRARRQDNYEEEYGDENY